MPSNTDEGETRIVAPDEAFAVLGNETRMEILQALGEVAGFREADESMSFSELRDRVGIRDSGQFNYHLDQLTGHFIRKTDDGYTLRPSGRRVIEAVLSGTVTEVPDLTSAQVDWSCPYCDAPVEVTYDETVPFPVTPYCTECAGLSEYFEPFEYGQLAALRLSPAGLHGRTPRELLQAAITWSHLQGLAAYCGVCPYCSGPIEHSLSVCETHDTTDGDCPDCNRPYAAQLYSYCTNCIFETEESFAADLVIANTDVLAFLAAHGINPITDPWGPVLVNSDEEILSTEPFKARFTLTIDDESLTLTVDDDLSVVDVSISETT